MNLKELIFTKLGEVSMCWSETPKGEFNSTRVGEIGDEIMEAINGTNPKKVKFRKELECLINSHSLERGSDTPDYILAEYLQGCLENFDHTLEKREQWYDRTLIRNEKRMVLNPKTGKYMKAPKEFADTCNKIEKNLNKNKEKSNGKEND